ncbi:MauE/DoxX family redox-associated membrane protein [Filimonas effusa]|uniref:Methylamine utilisation protein MauE domain-containing protein n=1 Tax=Filimonas effusa TaxID=2508721 RepID=A0A4Q1D1N3_9BACT|nr:MauE/DoxX family redox-associated membrane protein [Filimonas effusa]RXK81766.1 hypothetical protein ESB13_18410 [Filimonas effusa]
MRTSSLCAFALEALVLFFLSFYAYTAFSKFWDYRLFLVLARFQPGVGAIPMFLKIVFPLAEISLAILLLFSHLRKPVFYIIIISLSIILCYRLFLLVKGVHLPCVCGPLFRGLSEFQHLLFNAVLLVLALGAILLIRSSVTKSPRI